MRVFPRSPWRVIALIVVGIGVIAWRIAYIWPPMHLYDYAGVHPDQLEDTFNFNYAWLRERFGVDVRLILVNDAAIVDLDGFAVGEARRLRVGSREGGQGMLVAINYATGRMRLEVGPGLQGVFTDAFTGYLLRNHLALFTDPSEAELGLRSFWHLIHQRTIQSIADDEWDPTRLERVRDSTRLAIGGGAATTMPAGGRTRARLPESVRRTLGPQPTPEALLDAYRRWVTLDPIDVQVGLFTARSRSALAGNPHTRLTQDIELWKVHGRPYRFIVRDTLAIMYTTTTPIIPPSLLARSDSGWQFNVDVEWQHVVPLFSTPFTWGWQRRDDVVDRAFADVFYSIDEDFMRLRPGNNRPLPVRRTRWE
jgi:hypothetical protein